MAKTRSRRRTKVEMQAARETEWRALVQSHTGNYVCRWCGELKYCRGKTKARMACEECFLAKGPPKIPHKNVERATLSLGNQPKGGTR